MMNRMTCSTYYNPSGHPLEGYDWWWHRFGYPAHPSYAMQALWVMFSGETERRVVKNEMIAVVDESDGLFYLM